MSDLASRIERALRRLNEGRATAADMTLLAQAGRDGGLVLATGERSVVIRGDVSGFATLTGDVKANVINLTAEACKWLVEARFPPALHTLPAPVADFTGRDKEIAALLAHLSGEAATALISGIRGMGGVGKTELALAVAERLAARYPDAQLLIELQPGGLPHSPETLLRQVIHAFQSQAALPDRLEELQPLYRAALHGKRGLLLLDNAAEGAQVEPLLPPPAGWVVLVTSRQRFLLPAAHLLDLDVLPEEEARALLRRMLAAGDRDPTDAQVACLAGLCACLPKALRLAVGYLTTYRDMSARDYLAALEKERLKYLAVQEKTVAAVLGLSVTRLEQEDATLARRWRQLAVFPAPFDRRAAAAVWQLEEEEAQAALGELGRRTLLDWDETTAAYSLHDLLREYALQPSSGGAPVPADEPALRLRHAAHYLVLGSQADDLYKEGGEQVLEGLRQFDAAWAHLEAAWRWLRRREDEPAARWLSAFPNQTPYVLDLRLAPRQMVPILESALDAARRLGERRAEGVHLGNLGNAYNALGEPQRAIEYHEQALAIHREIGDRRGEGNALGNLGNACYLLGDAQRAIDYHEQALGIDRQIGDRHGEGNALGNLGSAYAALGDLQRAIDHYEQALAIDREIGDRRGEGQDLGNLGNAYAALGDPQRAIAYYEQALAIDRQIGDRHGEGQDLGNLGIVYRHLGDPQRAIECHEQALAIARQIGDRRGEATRAWNLGLAHKDLGECGKAASLMQITVDYERAVGHPDAEKDARQLEEVRRRAGQQPEGR